MEELRELMYEYIELYGLTDEKTVEVSQELHEYIVKSIKGDNSIE